MIEREHEKYLRGGPGKISPFYTCGDCQPGRGAGPDSLRVEGPKLGYLYRVFDRCVQSETASKSFSEETRTPCCGGAEAAITPMGVGGFAAMRALSTRNEDPDHASRPFDADRDGFVIGEGAGVLLLEELERARGRGAKIYAELVGYGMSSDAFHITQPSENGDGAVRVMTNAIKDAGIQAQDVDYINAHGTSTHYNDKLETLAIKKVFGDSAYSIPVSSTKSMMGHLLGAAGGVEAGIIALALHDQIVPPTANYEKPDPDCDLDYVPNGAAEDQCGMRSNSFGFGGTNAALLMKRYDGD